MGSTCCGHLSRPLPQCQHPACQFHPHGTRQQFLDCVRSSTGSAKRSSPFFPRLRWQIQGWGPDRRSSTHPWTINRKGRDGVIGAPGLGTWYIPPHHYDLEGADKVTEGVPGPGMRTESVPAKAQREEGGESRTFVTSRRGWWMTDARAMCCSQDTERLASLLKVTQVTSCASNPKWSKLKSLIFLWICLPAVELPCPVDSWKTTTTTKKYTPKRQKIASEPRAPSNIRARNNFRSHMLWD